MFEIIAYGYITTIGKFCEHQIKTCVVYLACMCTMLYCTPGM